jgi:RNA polymerase sigma-70 factor (ECF subfamily)
MFNWSELMGKRGDSKDTQVHTIYGTLRNLMILAQNGDKNAYKSLLKESSILIERFLRTRVSDVSAREDILQETLIGLHKAKHTYDPDKSFSSWFFAIARHKMIDYFRKTGRQGRHEILDDDIILMYAAAEEEVDSDELEFIREKVSKLPGKQRQVIELLKLNEFTVKEVAEKLGMSESAVKVTAHRAYKILRVSLKELSR